MPLGKAVEEVLRLHRRVQEFSIAHEKAVEADRELCGTLQMLGFAKQDSEYATRATDGEPNFDVRLRRALKLLRG